MELGCAEHALSKMQPLDAPPEARPVALRLRARALVDLKRFPQALETLVELRRVEHDADWVDTTEAWCRKRLADVPGAIAFFTLARRSDVRGAGALSGETLSRDQSRKESRAFEAAVMVLLRNGKGVLAQVAAAISAAEADITHLDMGEERAADTAELKLLISVRDRLHLADVLRTVRRAPAVLRVWRVKP